MKRKAEMGSSDTAGRDKTEMGSSDIGGGDKTDMGSSNESGFHMLINEMAEAAWAEDARAKRAKSIATILSTATIKKAEMGGSDTAGGDKAEMGGSDTAGGDKAEMGGSGCPEARPNLSPNKKMKRNAEMGGSDTVGGDKTEMGGSDTVGGDKAQMRYSEGFFDSRQSFAPCTYRNVEEINKALSLFNRKALSSAIRAGFTGFTDEDMAELFPRKNGTCETKHEAATKHAEVALKAYNAANVVDLELVKVGCIRSFVALVNGSGGMWLHFNFLAKPKGSSSDEEQLYFAEFKCHYHEYMVNRCLTVDPHNAGNDCRCNMACMICGSKVIHPPSGVEAAFHALH